MKQGEHNEIKQELILILTQIRELTIRLEALEEQLQETTQTRKRNRENNKFYAHVPPKVRKWIKEAHKEVLEETKAHEQTTKVREEVLALPNLCEQTKKARKEDLKVGKYVQRTSKHYRRNKKTDPKASLHKSRQ